MDIDKLDELEDDLRLEFEERLIELMKKTLAMYMGDS